jgi:PhzF family phenazine biosynthesis protein
MLVQRLASFSNQSEGGNPAGVVISEQPLSAEQMQRIAKEVGYSETAFAVRGGNGVWRVRYFSPEIEVPFCGHATIALGAALAMREGDKVFPLQINNGSISVAGRKEGALHSATLTSPPTRSQVLSAELLGEVLQLFGLKATDLDTRLVPAVAHAGADHPVLLLKSRQLLADMRYDMETGRALLSREEWLTILLGFAETPQLFHTRNIFPTGGVYEDPATGAGTAALAGYLRDIDWPHAGRIDVHQGDDMRQPSRLRADISGGAGSPIQVSGCVRPIR